MHPFREKMNRALKVIAVAKLRQLEFKGSFPRFRRIYQKRADLTIFQFNKYGGSSVVEIASFTTEQIAAPSHPLKTRLSIFQVVFLHPPLTLFSAS